MQIQIEAALADAVAGELAGIRRERGQLDWRKLVAMSVLCSGSNGVRLPLMLTGAYWSTLPAMFTEAAFARDCSGRRCHH